SSTICRDCASLRFTRTSFGLGQIDGSPLAGAYDAVMSDADPSVTDQLPPPPPPPGPPSAGVATAGDMPTATADTSATSPPTSRRTARLPVPLLVLVLLIARLPCPHDRPASQADRERRSPRG